MHTLNLASTLFFALLLGSMPFVLYAQQADTTQEGKRICHTQRIAGQPPTIDGSFDDAAWAQVDWNADFTQRQPHDGAAPTRQTRFKVLYDAKNLYFAIRCFDDAPDKIVRRMSRRDGFEGDWVEVNIDSYFDKRTAFSFTISASGVKGDEYVSNNGDNWDSNWDPIWYARTAVDEQGWIAELRIPLSQLRFADKAMHTWGLQVQRRDFRIEERSIWQYVPQNVQGWVHRFGEIHGLEGIKPQKQLEIQPYVVSQFERFEKEEGNPFATGKSSDITYGVDGKVGITSDITLDFTINPDFGQVEADPSQVNLSAFQVFFREQRPFFIEGNNILDFRITRAEAGGPFGRDNLFYSRRIGRRPHLYPDTEDGEYVNQPSNSAIIGAFKLTGKNKNGLSWGINEAITAKEEAEIDHDGERRMETVEPLTSYFVGRVQQDIKAGKTIVGGIFTATNRNIDTPTLDFLHKAAYTGGLDVTHFWNDRSWFIAANMVYSHVQGSEEAILETQTASEHLFQRPDAPHLRVDSTLTSLQGSGGTLRIGNNSGNVVFETGVTYRSPGLELNDLGFQRNADQIYQFGWMQYRKLEPFSIFRSFRINFNEWLNWDFAGVNTFRSVNTNAHVQFNNFWRMGSGSTVEFRNISNFDLRGGPALQYPGGANHWYYIGTDDRKKFRVNVNQWNWWGFQNSSRATGVDLSFTYRPMNALTIRFSPGYNYNDQQLQYVTNIDTDGGTRYVNGTIKQKTYSASLRFTYNINPNLSIQYWGQPFASTGQYKEFKYITDARAAEWEDRFALYTNEQLTYNE